MDDKIEFIVSACLAGQACRYDGKAQPDEYVCELVKSGRAIAVCPECMGGMATPREPSEIVQGDGHAVLCGDAKVLNRLGEDVTEQFVQGAKEVVAIAKRYGVKRAILKRRSPSCGKGEIYDGSFSGAKRQGDGVAAALLMQSGVQVENR